MTTIKRLTIPQLQAMKARGERIAMLTCYDATFARLVDGSGVELILVGDSLGMVIQGHDTTLPVTVDEVCYHTRCVVRGTRRAHVIADLPFLSYQTSISEAVQNAGRMLKEGGAMSVKLEGGVDVAPTVRAMTSAGIPVMGHIGLQPQSVHQLGGYKIQGKTLADADRLRADAEALVAAGVYAIVLEGVTIEVARELTRAVPVPTIGINAGPHCDGQVLVLYDLLGLDPSFAPRFVKRYAELAGTVTAAIQQYCTEVKAGAFPTEQHAQHRIETVTKTG